MINLIGQDAEINQSLQKYPSANLSIAIFGTQSTGKSTLLNHAFNCDFSVLNTQQTRQRCTRGVWLQNKNNLNIIDTEGFDSVQRKSEEKIMEKQVSLFCLALADVILINLFMNQIGRYEGQHVQIIEAIAKVSERLIGKQNKKIIFVVRDFTEDANKMVIKQQISKRVNKILPQGSKTNVKFVIQYFFLSHFIYQPEKFTKEAKQLTKTLLLKKKSVINNYEQKDRLLFIKKLWQKIKSSENSIDMRSVEDAVKTFVLQRTKGQCQKQLEVIFKEMEERVEMKSFTIYLEIIKKKTFEFFMKQRPAHIQKNQIQKVNQSFIEANQYKMVKFYKQNLLSRCEQRLCLELKVSLEKIKQPKKLKPTLTKKKKQVTDDYKKIITNHKDYETLIKNFHDKVDQIVLKYERFMSHLFSQFQIKIQKQLNEQLDIQMKKMIFNPEKINTKKKQLYLEYQYNDWEVDFKDIWQKVSYRFVEKTLPLKIQQLSRKKTTFSLTGGSERSNIIAQHTKIEKQASEFCQNVLSFFDEERTFAQPLSEIKQKIRQCLTSRLEQQKKKFRLSLTLISIIMLLFYGQMYSILKFCSFKKKKRTYWLRVYLFISLSILVISVWRQYMKTKKQDDNQIKPK